MESQFQRIEYLIGEEAVCLLKRKRIAVFGVGGVGGYVIEALARSGIGNFTIVDQDIITITNLNRQVIALHSTIGRAKVEVMKERILDINKSADVDAKKCFFLPENASEFDFTTYDYVVDAIDTITSKIELIQKAKIYKVPIISSMGAGNKLNPSGFIVSDISKTEVCPLAKVMRKELKKREIFNVKVVYSKEEPVNKGFLPEGSKKAIPGSVAYVPSVVGLLLASEVIKDLIS